MPKKYLKIKKNLMESGKPAKAAKKIAAATYNAQRKPGQKPVTPGAYERSLKKKR